MAPGGVRQLPSRLWDLLRRIEPRTGPCKVSSARRAIDPPRPALLPQAPAKATAQRRSSVVVCAQQQQVEAVPRRAALALAAAAGERVRMTAGGGRLAAFRLHAVDVLRC